MHRSNEPAHAGGTTFVREAGAEIAGHLWTKRRPTLNDPSSVQAALEWSRAQFETQEAVHFIGKHDPRAELAALACSERTEHSLGGLLETTMRELRLARFVLEPSPSTSPYATIQQDARETLRAIERKLEAASKLLYLEQDAVVFALHAAACGAFPQARECPGEYPEHEAAMAGPSSALELVAGSTGASRLDVAAASAAFLALGVNAEAVPTDSVAELLVTMTKVRVRLEGRALARPEAELELAGPMSDDDDRGNEGTGGSTPPSSSPPVAPPAPAGPTTTMVPSTLASPPWRGAPPAPRAPARTSRLRVVASSRPRLRGKGVPASGPIRKGAA